MESNQMPDTVYRTSHSGWVGMLIVAAMILFPQPSVAFQPGQIMSDVQLREKVVRSLRDGTDFLKRRQQPGGFWSGDRTFDGKEIGVT